MLTLWMRDERSAQRRLLPIAARRRSGRNSRSGGWNGVRVAILEDEAAHADLLTAVVESEGHTVARFHSGREVVARLRQETFDLLLLDWNLPDLSGLEVLNWVRSSLSSPPPVLMITARNAADDIVRALDAGADDFVVKPIDRNVLTARIRAVLRRAYPSEVATGRETFAGYEFDPMTETVTWSGQSAKLTSKEFALALTLFRNLNRPLGRSYLMESIWGRHPNLATRTLDAHVSRVRTKLSLRPEFGYRLAPVYSYGYRLEATHEQTDEPNP